jgi:hypothetical protein
MRKPDPRIKFLQDQLKVLDQALARKPREVRPEDFQVTRQTSIRVIHGKVSS